MIELNKQYRYKNKIVVPMVIDNGNIICFDNKGASIFVKKESELTKIEEENKIVEPTYVKTVEPVVEVPKPVEQVVEEKPAEAVKAEESAIEVPKPAEPVVQKEEPKAETKPVDYDDFYEVPVPTKTITDKKKRVNITEKNEYI